MAPALRSVFVLRDQDRATWYRLLYVKIGGVVYVLHGFTKKTNQTAKGDIEIGRNWWKDGRIMPRPLDLSETDLFA
jgi:phage-related protein